MWKLPTSTQLHATWHTNSLDMLVLPSTSAFHYHKCCIDVGTSLEYFGYTLIYCTITAISTATVVVIIISVWPLGQSWQEPEPSQATGMALARCILGKFLGVVCHCFPLPLDVPTFAARCLHILNNASAPSSERWNCGREWCPLILPKWRLFMPFRDLLHVANLRHGANGMLRIFSPEKSDIFGWEWTRDLGYQRPAC
jgi:hypothetical protein